jgi:hypothetical protein
VLTVSVPIPTSAITLASSTCGRELSAVPGKPLPPPNAGMTSLMGERFCIHLYPFLSRIFDTIAKCRNINYS